LGRVETVTHSDGTVLTTNYTGPATQVIDEGTVSSSGPINIQRISQVDGLGRLTRVCEVSSQILSVGSGATPADCGTDVSATGFVTTYSYDTLGNLISVSQGGYLPRSFTYDSFSRLITANNPESGTTCYGQWSGSNCINGYDPDGNLINRTRPKANQTDANTRTTTTYSYDELHRLRSKSYSDGTPTASFNYDEATITATTPQTTLTNAIGRQSSTSVGSAGSLFSYDSMGRLLNAYQCTPRTCPGNSYYGLAYQYDLLGDMTSSTNGVGVNFAYAYNAAGRLTTITSSASQGPSTLLSHVAYGPFGITSALFGNGWGETRSYHQRGWLQSQQDGPATVHNPTPSTATISITDGLHYYWQQTQWAAPGTGSVTITGAEQSVYDPNADCEYIGSRLRCYGAQQYDTGVVTVTVNGYSKSSSYGAGSTTYGIAADLANQFASDPSSPVNASPSGATVYFTARWNGSGTNYPLSWDAYTTNTAYFWASSFGVSPSGASLTGGQDDVYVPIYDSGTTNVTVAGYSHNWPWSGSGTTAANIASNMAAIIERDNPYVHASAAGNAITLTSRTPGSTGNNYSFTSGTSSSQGSFPTSPSSSAMTPGTDFSLSINSPVYSFNLGFTGNGDIQTGNDSVNGYWTYTYDQFNRLSTAVASNITKGCQETYDRFGNRWNQQPYGGTGYSCNAFPLSFTSNNNRMDGYSYDAAGNLLNDGNHRYAYDAENHLKCVDPDPTTWSCTTATMLYTYDAEGHRVRASNPAGTSGLEYLYDLQDHAITHLNVSTGGWVRGEIFAGASHLATYADGTTYFNETDWLGTERSRSNMSAAQCQTTRSLPFGDGTSNPINICNPTLDFFTGKERDSESSLDYFGARYYSSRMGQFLSADPSNAGADALDPQSWNAYSYGGNNPVTRIDPNGEDYHLCNNNGVCKDVTDAEYEKWRREQGDNIYVTPSGKIIDRWLDKQIGTATWFDGDGARGAQASVALLNFFVINQALDALGGLAGATVSRFISEIPQVRINRFVGLTVGENVARVMLRLKGYKILGRNVTVRTSRGIRYVDFVVEKAGEIIAIEVKTGGSVRTKLQLAKDAAMEIEGGTLTGANAGALEGQTLKLRTIEVRPF
jgi:RHS repeat-associated protein